MIIRRWFAYLLAGFAVASIGCGGGSTRIPINAGGSYVAAKVPINWATRARIIGGPSSALSVVVTFDLAGTSHQNVTLEADRNTPPGGYQQTYTTDQTVQTGIEPIHVRFYSQAGAQGSLVGEADASVLVKPDGTLAQANGSPLTGIQLSGTVSMVSIAGPSTVTVGAAAQPIQVAAFDAGGDLLAVSAGSVFFQLANGSGTASIDSNGEISGTVPGNVVLTATIDGVSSFPVNVTVIPAAVSLFTLRQATSAMALDPATNHVWAAVPGTDPKYGNSVIEIDPSTQKVVSTVQVGSDPTIMAFSDDGTALYVGLQGSDSFARVDPVAKRVVGTYPLGPTPDSQYAVWMSVEPGNPNVVALSQQDDQDTGFNGGCIYNNGVLLPNFLGTYGGDVLGFSSPTTLWLTDAYFSPQGLMQASVDSTGSTSTSGGGQSVTGVFWVIGGNLYFSDGQVMLGTTGDMIGTYPVGSGGGGVAVDLANQITYFIGGSSGSYTISSFGTTTFKSISTYSVPISATSVFGLSLVSPGQLAFADGTNVYFATLPGSGPTRRSKQAR